MITSPVADPAAEPEALGPLATDDTLRGRVIRAAQSAVADARSADAVAASAPHAAVLEVRKALRRLRALVDLVARTLPKRERKDLIRGLSMARKSLGPARDQEVAESLVAAIAVTPDLHAAAQAITATAAPDRAQPEAIVDDVHRAVAEAATHADAFIAALPDPLRPRRIARGLARTYARARSARRHAKKSDRAVHRFRRRSKELAYQLQIVDVLPGAAELRDALVALDDQLGPVVDHLMAKDYVRLYSGAGPADASAALLAAVHDQLLAGKDAARAGSRGLFKNRPKQLRGALISALAGAAAVTDHGHHDPGDHDD